MNNFNNIKLNKIQTMFIYVYILLFIAFIFSSVINNGNLSKIIFLIICLVSVSVIVSIFISLFKHWHKIYFERPKSSVLEMINHADKKIKVLSFCFSIGRYDVFNIFSGNFFDNYRRNGLCRNLYVLKDTMIYIEFNDAVIFDRNCIFEIDKSFGCLKITINKNDKFYCFYVNSDKNSDYLTTWVKINSNSNKI